MDSQQQLNIYINEYQQQPFLSIAFYSWEETEIGKIITNLKIPGFRICKMYLKIVESVVRIRNTHNENLQLQNEARMSQEVVILKIRNIATTQKRMPKKVDTLSQLLVSVAFFDIWYLYHYGKMNLSEKRRWLIFISNMEFLKWVGLYSLLSYYSKYLNLANLFHDLVKAIDKAVDVIQPFKFIVFQRWIG
eukprot:TRINITY_DN17683_c0_g4_i1.p2 TRINITY_DN17683_c0_g4~~TRINITY_DN17683_c0_g4_i1.p2  ORF type:complete len:191 (+),score=5.49 TRINITY_DN17683_c0_g4_i1:450-1022(+)